MKAEATTINQTKQKVESITANGRVAGQPVTFEAKKGRLGFYTLARKFGLQGDQKPNHAESSVRVKTLDEAVELLTSNDGKDYSIWCYYKSKDKKVTRRNLYSIDTLTFHLSAKGEGWAGL